MDTDLVRTFLEVHRVRHFARAAERLFVTPAAVSARVRLLEAQLGTQLFNRARNNIRLTAAGQRFLPHAEHLLRSLDRAMLSVGTAREDVQLVALGCLQSIWSVLLRGWLAEIHRAEPGALLQLELLTTADVVARVREQSLDLGLVYEPPRASDLSVERLGEMALHLVADQPGLAADLSLPGYLHVDWGTSFALGLGRALPHLPEPILRLDSPDVAYDFIVGQGGAAFLPELAVREDIEQGRLHAVAGAPVIERPVFVIASTSVQGSAAHAEVRDALLDWVRVRTSRCIRSH
ncbi:MAG: LysR substrate-binding domain-containing protein [Gammaproteobacteria bacterium]|nr:LysR substrate-binding domain-containing protein [Gammaproteobacteria bacterium]